MLWFVFRKFLPTDQKCGNISQIKFDLWLLSHPPPQENQGPKRNIYQSRLEPYRALELDMSSWYLFVFTLTLIRCPYDWVVLTSSLASQLGSTPAHSLQRCLIWPLRPYGRHDGKESRSRQNVCVHRLCVPCTEPNCERVCGCF